MLIDILFLYIPALHANDNSHLHLIVNVSMNCWVKLQVLPWKQKRRKWLVEPHGLRWHYFIHLCDMCMVVGTNAEDFPMVFLTVIGLIQ